MLKTDNSCANMKAETRLARRSAAMVEENSRKMFAVSSKVDLSQL